MKDRNTYKILTLLSWFLPMNRFYIGEKITFGRLITFNYFMLGVFPDLLYMDKRFDEAMARRGFMNTNTRNEHGK